MLNNMFNIFNVLNILKMLFKYCANRFITVSLFIFIFLLFMKYWIYYNEFCHFNPQLYMGWRLEPVKLASLSPH